MYMLIFSHHYYHTRNNHTTKVCAEQYRKLTGVTKHKERKL